MNQIIDLGFTVTSVTTFHKVLDFASVETAVGRTQLEGPQEIVGSLEVGADSHNFVDQVFHTNNAKVAQSSLDDLVVRKRNTLTVHFTMASLVDQLTNTLQVGIAVSNVGLNKTEHLAGGMCQADKDTIVDLNETQKL